MQMTSCSCFDLTLTSLKLALMQTSRYNTNAWNRQSQGKKLTGIAVCKLWYWTKVSQRRFGILWKNGGDSGLVKCNSHTETGDKYTSLKTFSAITISIFARLWLPIRSLNVAAAPREPWACQACRGPRRRLDGWTVWLANGGGEHREKNG